MRLLSSRRAESAGRLRVSRLAETGRRLKALLTGDAGRLAAYVEEPGLAWPLVCAGVTTNSAPFIGGLHLVFWTVSAVFALRLLSALFDFLGSREKSYLHLWFVVFLLVCLRMTTALRPILGRSESFLPAKKLFFLSHWSKNLSGEAE